MPSRRTRRFDWLVAVTGLFAGSLLLSRGERRRAIAAGSLGDGVAEDDLTSRAGRGRPDRQPSHAASAAGHETLDTDVLAIVRALGLLFAIATASVLGLLGLLAFFRADLAASRPSGTPEQAALIDPPRPQLETRPEGDEQRQAAADTARLDGYAWLDAGHTQARLPIERAMALVVGHSLDAAR